MKKFNPLCLWLLAIGSLVFRLSSYANEAQFFRIAGPVATTITAISADGNLTWTNELTNATFTVQTALPLTGSTDDWMDYAEVPVTNSVTTLRIFDLNPPQISEPNPPSGMALIPIGSFPLFMMGSCEGLSDALPLHPVKVSAFYMDKYDVTEALWQQVYNWAITNGYSFDPAGSVPGSNDSKYSKGTNYPVVRVDWYSCVKWCNARSEMEGRVPAYYTSAAQTTVYRTGQTNVFNDCVKWNAGYRLPTEAEWEKAARGGVNRQLFPWGDKITHSQANYYSSSSYIYDTSRTRGYHPDYKTSRWPYTSPVGSFAPNAYGLYDMAGNVGQWCWDWYGSYDGADVQTDPRGPFFGSERVYRGGDCESPAILCQTAYRTHIRADFYVSTLGFRSVLPLGQKN